MEFTHVWDHIKARPWRSLLDLELHCNMFPLTLILQLQLTEKEKLFFREFLQNLLWDNNDLPMEMNFDVGKNMFGEFRFWWFKVQ